MKVFCDGAQRLFLAGLLFLGTGVAPAHAGTSWCTEAMHVLGQSSLTPAGMAALLLERQEKPLIALDPERRVFVSSQAAGAGDGTKARPFRSLQIALNRAKPGDQIIVAPGAYAPSVIKRSGTPSNPIIVSGQSDASGRPVIDGTDTKVRGLIEIRGASHITVSGFRLQNAPRDGIFVEGTIEGERDIRILDNDIDTTGNSAIFVAGIVMRFITKVDEYRLFDVLVQGNRITNTNTPKGVNEAISLGGGVDGFVIRNNYIFDTRQYGIDAKAGAINGVITENVMHGIQRHGIYLDTGSRRVANIHVTRNAVFGARNGIVMAREANRDPEHPNLHNITVTDNLVFDIDEFGIKAYRHPDDSGIGQFSDITIAENCLCGIRRDAVRLGGIGDFARNIAVENNLILSSGGGIWNQIGARTANNSALPAKGQCPM